MTKTNKKNIFLGIGIISILGTIFGTSTGLYLSAGKLENIANKREYLIKNNQALTLDGYFFDPSTSYGGMSNKSLLTLTGSNLIRIKTTGETKFIKNSIGESVVSVPTNSKRVLDLAKEIILTFESNNTDKNVIFNNDISEISTFIKKPEETITLKSNNKFSINSYYFDKLLLGKAGLDENGFLDPDKSGYILKSVGFTVKENIPWVDHNGNKTNYKIKVEDFWYSYMRTWLYDSNFRRMNGGSKELDNYFINKTSTINRFQDQKEYPNDYLFDLFGINSKLLQIEKNTIKKVEINGVLTSSFTMNSIKGKKTNFTGILNKIFFDSCLLLAAPSEFINDLVEKNKNVEYDSIKIEGLAKKFGIYIYGQKRSDNLFASPFIPVSGKDNRIVFEKNKFFANSEFVNDETSLSKIIFEHSTSSTYNNQLFNGYFQKTISEMSYTDLTQQQKIKVFGKGSYKEALNNGLLQVKQLNKSKLVQRTLLSTDPRKLTKEEKDSFYSLTPEKRQNPYLFNNEYSKFMYGAPIYPSDNNLNEPNILDGTAKTAETFFVGSGFKLRTLINASINWYTFINNTWKGTKRLWLNQTAPNAIYNSSNESTPIHFIDEINNVTYFDGKNKNTITEAQMKEKFNNNLKNADEQFKTHKFEEIKKIIKKLLDENNISNNKPLEWAITYPYNDAQTQIIKIQQIEKIIKIIKLLDPRLKPYLNIPNDRSKLMESINQNKGISDFNGWGYDYEGIGTFLDGISHGTGISLLGAFSIHSNIANNEIRLRSPEFTKLSDYMKLKLNNILPIGKKMEDWINFTNDNNNKIDYFFGKEFEISIELAKFFVEYQEKINAIEITALIIELNLIAGFPMEGDIAITNLDSTSLSLVLSEYYYPTAKSGILYLSDIRVGDKND